MAGALNVDHHLMPAGIAEWAQTVSHAAASAGWHGVPADGSAVLDLYPIHPTVLPVLVRFFARFGQHERSLFSFLLSPEPFGLQAFADSLATARNWYRLPDFYDYVRAVFGHRLAGASYSSQWLRMTGTIDRAVAASDLDGSEIRVLKAVALLNVLDAEHLTATEAALSAALLDQESPGELHQTVTALKRKGLLFDRGAAGGYCLWPNTSVNLEAAFGLARRALGPADQIAAQLAPYLDESPVVARRHYITTGTLRHFELRHAEPAALDEAVSRPCEADGLIVVALCQTAAATRASPQHGGWPRVLFPRGCYPRDPGSASERSQPAPGRTLLAMGRRTTSRNSATTPTLQRRCPARLPSPGALWPAGFRRCSESGMQIQTWNGGERAAGWNAKARRPFRAAVQDLR